MENNITLREYFDKGTFVIPNYQRGYKWGVPNEDNSCAVSNLIDDLLKAFETPEEEYSIQGVTIYEENNKVILIDGQQRTITFFLLLKYLKYASIKNNSIEYDIRKESNHILNNGIIIEGVLTFRKEYEHIDYDLQDIFYFKKAVNTFNNKKIDQKPGFTIFLLDKVKLFYIIIDKVQSVKVFTMLNGQKAFMKANELIKASLLSEISQSDLNETEINSLRSRYAREWDKWRYWWNNDDVKLFFGCNNPMGLLLEYYYYINNITGYSNKPKDAVYTYKVFKNNFINDNKQAKKTFRDIRDLQMTFENWFNSTSDYNWLGLILKAGNIDKKVVLLYFLNPEIKDKLSFSEYAKWALVAENHNQIISILTERTKEEMALSVLNNLSSSNVYENYPNQACSQLLRMNIDMDSKLNRKFNFKIFDKQKSLEHVHPKSKVYKIINGENIRCTDNTKCTPDGSFILSSTFYDNVSEHSIGNLLLLTCRDNSIFSNKSFYEKKDIYFGSTLDIILDSVAFLHTLNIFSKNSWDIDSINENKISFLSDFKKTYKLINYQDAK